MAENETNSVVSEKAEPVISHAKSSQEQPVRYFWIGDGFAGAAIAKVGASQLKNSFITFVNSSDQDLEQVTDDESKQFKIVKGNVNGAGKDRKEGKRYFKEYRDTCDGKSVNVVEAFNYYYGEQIWHPTVQTIIINCFSSDGGTGSGVGPLFTAMLTQLVATKEEFVYNGKVYSYKENPNMPRPVVIGLVPKCNSSLGQKNLLNTIDCFYEIQKLVSPEDPKAPRWGNFFIADNNLPASISYNNTREMYDIINARIIIPLVKFLGLEINSSIKCLDLQDKINTLRIPGCSSFTSVSAENKFQYVIPRGQSCARIVEITKFTEDGSEERASKQLIKNYNIESRDPMQAFFELDKMGLNGLDAVSKSLVESSMIAFIGFNSLNAIIEDLRAAVHRLQEANDKKAEIVKHESKGFSSLAEDIEMVNDSFSMNVNGAGDANLMDLV